MYIELCKFDRVAHHFKIIVLMCNRDFNDNIFPTNNAKTL